MVENLVDICNLTQLLRTLLTCFAMQISTIRKVCENNICCKNGNLAGKFFIYLSILAQCAVVAPLEAFAIGLIGGALTIGCHELITRVLRVDDPVGSVSVHGVGGAWGVISFAIFAHSDFTEVGLIEEAGS